VTHEAWGDLGRVLKVDALRRRRRRKRAAAWKQLAKRQRAELRRLWLVVVAAGLKEAAERLVPRG
jgi:hypothetical protein